jgi:hypothetical protein
MIIYEKDSICNTDNKEKKMDITIHTIIIIIVICLICISMYIYIANRNIEHSTIRDKILQRFSNA